MYNGRAGFRRTLSPDPQFREAECEVYGISRDSLKSHGNFKGKCDFPFELLSDPEEEACDIFRRHQDEEHVWQTGSGRGALNVRVRP
jgi:peroxiredoxin